MENLSLHKPFLEEDLIINTTYYDHFQSHILCNIDLSLVVDPVLCSNCEGVFCSECIETWLKVNNKCPNKCPVKSTKIIPLTTSAKKIIEGLKLKCKYGCEVSLLDYIKHQDTCEFAETKCWACTTTVLQKDIKVPLRLFNDLKNKLNRSKFMLKNYAIDLSRQNRFEEAQQMLDKAIELDPLYEFAYLYKGIIFKKMEKYKESLDAFFKSMQIDCYSSQGKFEMANLMSKAPHIIDEYIEEASKTNDILSNYNLGILNMITTNIDKAEEYLNKCVSIDSNYTSTYAALAYVSYKCRKNINKAHEILSKAVELDPKNKFLLKDIAWILTDLNLYDVSSKFHKASIDIDNNFLPAILNYGYSKSRQANYEEAKRNYKKILDIDPYYFIAITNTALLEYSEDKDEVAKELLLGVLKIDPDYTFANRYIGDMYLNEKKYKEALVHYEIVSKYDRFSDESFVNLGKVYFFLLNYQSAITNFKEALKLNPVNPEALALCEKSLKLLQQKMNKSSLESE